MKEEIKIERSTEGVRDFMFEEMERLANGEIEIDRLKAMSKAGDTILKSAVIDIQVRKLLRDEQMGRRGPREIADMNLNVMLTGNTKKLETA